MSGFRIFLDARLTKHGTQFSEFRVSNALITEKGKERINLSMANLILDTYLNGNENSSES